MDALSSVARHLYRLQNLRCPEHLVQTRAQAGAAAILLFTTEELARRFVDGKKLSNRLTWIRMDESAAARWLVDVETHVAAELVVINADPAEILQQQCEPINEVLTNLRFTARHGQMPSASIGARPVLATSRH